MAEQQVLLTAEERKCLMELLEWTLKEARVEEHRTRTPAFREHILDREEIVQALLNKLRQ